METEALRDAIGLDPLLLFKDLDVTGDSLGQPDMPALRKRPLTRCGNVVDFTVMQTLPVRPPVPRAHCWVLLRVGGGGVSVLLGGSASPFLSPFPLGWCSDGESTVLMRWALGWNPRPPLTPRRPGQLQRPPRTSRETREELTWRSRGPLGAPGESVRLWTAAQGFSCFRRGNTAP